MTAAPDPLFPDPARPRRPVVVPMADAVAAIRQAIGAADTIGTRAPRMQVVGITGPVGAGKSTLAARLSDCVLSTDDYLPDYDRTPEHLRDLPEHADLARLLEDLSSLRDGRVTRVPRWSFQSHSRVGEREVTPPAHRLIVIEGLHALHHVHAHALDVRVFVDAPATVRWQRWEQLESSGQRGWGVEYAREFFDRVAEPTFERYAPHYRNAASIIVLNDA